MASSGHHYRLWKTPSIPLTVAVLVSLMLVLLPLSAPARANPSLPTGVLSYVPITLTNSQSSATPTDFQQAVAIDWSTYSSLLNAGVSNVEFFDGSGSVLAAWCQSSCTSSSTSSTVWANLGSDQVPASGTLTIYVGFLATSTNNMGSSGSSVWGEQGQLSSTYGQYDDGSNVFSYYLNAQAVPSVVNEGSSYQGGMGETSNSGLSIVTAGGQQATKVAASTLDKDLYYFVSTPTLPSSFVATMWVYTSSSTSDNYLGVINSSTLDGYGIIQGDGGNSHVALYKSSARTNLDSVPYVYSYSTWNSETLQLGASGVLTGYSSPGMSLIPGTALPSATDTSYTSFNMIFFAPYYLSSGASMNIGLIAVRAYPPGGVMPTPSFGASFSLPEFPIQLALPLVFIAGVAVYVLLRLRAPPGRVDPSSWAGVRAP